LGGIARVSERMHDVERGSRLNLRGGLDRIADLSNTVRGVHLAISLIEVIEMDVERRARPIEPRLDCIEHVAWERVREQPLLVFVHAAMPSQAGSASRAATRPARVAIF
jgi:hypothetical protein